ncbi:MAG: hypothetical protein OEM41_05105 [Ignavibacteria bacterium]|nr:hypothetical protein [Ignavibacteria bacterium]
MDDTDAIIWQRDFYEHIIRSDIAHYFIAQYIMLNPFIWELDSQQSKGKGNALE